MDEFFKNLASFGLGGLIFGAVVYYGFTHPDVVEKWRALIFDWLSRINKKYKYHAAKNDIQAKINSFATTLSEDVDMDAPRVKIKWTAKDEDEDVQLEEDEVVIVMRDRGYKNKNFVHAAYFYTSTTLLRHTKRHLSKKQGEALDLYTTKKVIEQNNKAALEIFMRDYFQPLLEDEKITDLVNKFVKLDKSGFYTHILLQELTYLGSKTFLTKRDKAVAEEVSRLIDFLMRFAEREVGDDSIREEFIGKYSHCAIKIVSTKFVRESGNHKSPAKRVNKAFDIGIENVYVIGPSEDGGKQFIEQVCGSVIEQNKGIEIIKQDSFKGLTRRLKVEKQTLTHLIHLHNPSKAKYMIEDSMVEQIAEFGNEQEVDIGSN